MQVVTRLCGLAAGLLERSGRQFEPLERAEFTQTVKSTRASLGETAFTAARGDGQCLILDEALALAIRQSERTVEMHVSHALHKVGLSSRTQLATWAAQEGLVLPDAAG